MDIIITTKHELQELIESSLQSIAGTLKPQQEPNQYMNSEQLCEYLGISLSTLSNWKREKKIPYSKLGKKLLFDKTKVDKMIQKNEI